MTHTLEIVAFVHSRTEDHATSVFSMLLPPLDLDAGADVLINLPERPTDPLAEPGEADFTVEIEPPSQNETNTTVEPNLFFSDYGINNPFGIHLTDFFVDDIPKTQMIASIGELGLYDLTPFVEKLRAETNDNPLAIEDITLHIAKERLAT